MSCNFWKLKTQEYVLTDEKYVTLPMNLVMGKIFMNNNGVQVVNLLMHFKKATCFEVLKVQEESVMLSSGNAQGGGTQDARLPKKVTIRKNEVQKMDDAPGKFFSRYPLAKQYIDIENIERENLHKNQDNKPTGLLHYQGPIVFYAIFIIILFQIIQLFHYDIEQMYNLRLDLDQIFKIKPPDGLSDSEQGLYLSKLTSSKGFETWLKNMITTVYRSEVGTSSTLFSVKTYQIGQAAIIKYETKETACPREEVPGNFKCIFTNYNKDTQSRLIPTSF